MELNVAEGLSLSCMKQLQSLGTAPSRSHTCCDIARGMNKSVQTSTGQLSAGFWSLELSPWQSCGSAAPIGLIQAPKCHAKLSSYSHSVSL